MSLPSNSSVYNRPGISSALTRTVPSSPDLKYIANDYFFRLPGPLTVAQQIDLLVLASTSISHLIDSYTINRRITLSGSVDALISVGSSVSAGIDLLVANRLFHGTDMYVVGLITMAVSDSSSVTDLVEPKDTLLVSDRVKHDYLVNFAINELGPSFVDDLVKALALSRVISESVGLSDAAKMEVVRALFDSVYVTDAVSFIRETQLKVYDVV